MTFTYDGDTYSLPDTLGDITVAQYAAWTATYGLALEAERIEYQRLSDGPEKDLRLGLLYIERLTKAFSHFSTIPLADVETNIDITDVLSYVGATEMILALEERTLAIEASYEWSGDTWYPQAPSGDDLTTYEAFRATYDLAGMLLQLSEGDWSVMSALCASYVRLTGEDFDPAAMVPGSTREVLFQDLPLDIALPFSYFLKDAMTLFLTSLEAYV